MLLCILLYFSVFFCISLYSSVFPLYFALFLCNPLYSSVFFCILDEDLLDTSSASSQKAGVPSSGAKPVFCDATKQLLIKTLPLVLTLHLKRFLQDGRRCRKNGCHISFPALLNMAPYCVSDCNVCIYICWCTPVLVSSVSYRIIGGGKKFVGHCQSVMHEFAAHAHTETIQIFKFSGRGGGNSRAPLCMKPW